LHLLLQNKQEYTASNGATTDNSQIYFKDTKYHWINADDFQFDLNNGQPWNDDYQCVSLKCLENYCTGKSSGKGCYQHSDCKEGLACIASSTFPFATTWQEWKTSGTWVDDYDCDPRYFCWYANSANVGTSTKTCLEKFSLSDGSTFGWYSSNSDAALDGLENGQYCTSGFARESSSDTATCITITKVETDLGVQTSPYKWTATDTTNTWDYYYDNSNYVSSQWQCSLDGSSGYCPVPGQDELTTYVTYMKNFDKLNNCHTLDRNNYRRLYEDCAVVNDTDLEHWTLASGIYFNITFWPFIQGDTVSEWMQEVFYLSPYNLSKELGYYEHSMICIPLLITVMVFYLF